MTLWYIAPPISADVNFAFTGQVGAYTFGNDANNGLTQMTPKTLDGAYQAAAPGDEFAYIPGRYRANRRYTTTATQENGSTVAVADGSGAFAHSIEKAGILHRPLVPPVPAPSIYASGNPMSSRWSQTVEIECLRLFAEEQTVRGLKFVSPYWPNVTGRWKDTPLGDLYRLQQGFIGLLHIGAKNILTEQCEFFGGYGGAADPGTYPHGYGAEFSTFNIAKTGDTQLSAYNEFRSTAYWRLPGGSVGQNWSADANCEMWEPCGSGDLNARAGWGNTTCGVDPGGVAAAITANAGYNPFFWCPSGVNTRRQSGASCAGLTFRKNYFHDLRSGINALYQYSVEELTFDQNEFERIYMDHIFGGGSETIPTSPAAWNTYRNRMLKPFGEAKDLGNAHGDVLQLLLGSASTGKKFMDRVRIVRNFWHSVAGQRGFSQGAFIASNQVHQNNNDVVFARAPMAIQNVGIFDTQIGVQFSLCINAYTHENIFVSQPELASVDPAPAIFFEGMSAGRNPLLPAESSGLNLGSRNITDGGYISSTDGVLADYVMIGGKTLGKMGVGTPYSDIFKGTNGSGGGFGAGWAVTDPNVVFDAFQPRNSALHGGVVSTMEALLENPIPWDTFPLWIGWAPKKNVNVSTLTELEGAQVMGGGAPGTTVTITPDAGVEIKVTSIDEATDVQDWTSAPVAGVQRNIHRVKIRYTSSNLNSKALQKGVTINGTHFLATVTTKSSNALPRAVCDGTPSTGTGLELVDAGVGLGAGTNSPYMTLFLSIIPSAGDIGVSKELWQHHTGSVGPGLVNLSASSRFNTNLRNASNTVIMTHGTLGAPLVAGTLARLAMQIDMTQSSSTDGLKLYTIDANDTWTRQTPPGITWLGGAGHLIGFANTSAGSRYWFLRGSGTTRFGGTFEAFWMSNELVDLEDPNVRQRFTVDGLGYDGDGVISGVRPLVFFVGKAALLNTPTNLGRAPNTVNKFGTFTAGTPDVWPVPLTIVAEVLSVTAPTVGQPIDFLLYPTGANVALNVTGAASGAGTWDENPKAMADAANLTNGIVMTFTPSAAGTYTFTFTDNATPDYVNPDPIEIVVTDGVVPPPVLSGRPKRFGNGFGFGYA